MNNSRDIICGLGGRWYQNYGTAACPVCQPEGRKTQNALTLCDAPDGRLLVHCKKSQCDFREILSACGVTRGGCHETDAAEHARRDAKCHAEDEKRAQQADRLWQEAVPVNGTIAQTYLRGRAITCDLPDTLRFHSSAWHGPSARCLPALIARVDGAQRFGVHRTYLLPDGSGKIRAEPSKMMLGTTSGGAVRLSSGQNGLVVAEGIETALSLACGLLSAPAEIWAALSTSGMSGLSLPPNASRLVIAPDGDRAGQAAALKLATRAHALGWQVSLLNAPDGYDWNDVLTKKGCAA